SRRRRPTARRITPTMSLPKCCHTWLTFRVWTTRARRSIREWKANDPARHEPAHADHAVARSAVRRGACGDSDTSWAARAADHCSAEPVRILGGGYPSAGRAACGTERFGHDPGPGRTLAALLPTAIHVASRP